jgi:murein DD-endopeptidase MepM/ murein hydrolase activator NlpD
MACLKWLPGRVWLRGAALALLAVGAAGCSSDATRFGDAFSNPFGAGSAPSADVTGAAPAPIARVESKPVSQVALPPPSKPVANPPATYTPPHSQVNASPNSQTKRTHVHVVASGDTLMKLSRLYGKRLTELAKANNISTQTRLKIGERITVPGWQPVTAVAAVPTRQPAPSNPKLAAADVPQHTARIASPEPPQPETTTKTAEPAGGLPSFRWPVRGRVIAGFGPKPNGQQNDGINLAVPEGTPIKAAEDGVVAYAGNELKGYGNLVLIRHSNGFVTAYAHANEILAQRGDQVKRGQIIARSGQTGNVTSPQLHFEIRKGATPLDPMPFLNGN